jgi:tellurite resistance protein TerB
MISRSVCPNSTAAQLAADYFNHNDKDVLQALVTAGAFVALADGRVDAIERDELVHQLARQRLLAKTSQQRLAALFDDRAQLLEEPNFVGVIVRFFRPPSGLSLTPDVIRVAERVAAADRMIHPAELRALKLIRLIITTLPETYSRGFVPDDFRRGYARRR